MIRLDSERMDHSFRLAIDVVVDMLVALRCYLETQMVEGEILMMMACGLLKNCDLFIHCWIHSNILESYIYILMTR